MAWADGLEITPFEFLQHDVTHSNNRGDPEGYNADLEIKFINYLNTLKLDNKNPNKLI